MMLVFIMEKRVSESLNLTEVVPIATAGITEQGMTFYAGILGRHSMRGYGRFLFKLESK